MVTRAALPATPASWSKGAGTLVNITK